MVDIVFDILILILGFLVVFRWYPFITDTPFQKYLIPAFTYITLWFFVSYVLGRYYPLHRQKIFKVIVRLFYVTVLIFISFGAISLFLFNAQYSIYLIFTVTTILSLVNLLFYAIYFTILYAVEYDEPTEHIVEPRELSHIRSLPDLDETSYYGLLRNISVFRGEKVANALKSMVNIQNSGTLVLFNASYFDLSSKPNYLYSTVLNLDLLNNIRGIDRLLTLINTKLPDKGLFVCLFESKSTRKKRILNKYPRGINYIVYFFDFLLKRVIPKTYLTSRLYFDVTKGKKRILSKTEVLGRLYCNGFEVIKESKVDDLNVIVARRLHQPEPVTQKVYGPLIRLRRIGKNGKIFTVYKMRTMHPYSEYLQSYIFEKNKLSEGGKFNRDVRITTIGKFMRKYWLDELPMLINVLNGDMKIVGVRPLSRQYFSLYSDDLQKLRTQYRPGLLPPFYADMPKTLEEIQGSEIKYLHQCNKNGVFLTDIKYFFIILYNILFKHARSA